jgi:sugar transferase (PEP-CTERM/EpsH1 system associated)
VVPYTPNFIRSRSLGFIKALTANGHRVTVATLWSGPGERRDVEALAAQVSAVIAEPIGRARSLWNCLCAVPTGEPLQARYSWSPDLSKRLTQAVRQQPFDVVHVEHLRGARYGLPVMEALKAAGVRTPVVWDSVDCISDLFRKAARHSRTATVRWAARVELPRTERYEGSVASRFARVLTTAEEDRQGLLRLAARELGAPAAEALASRIVVVKNGIDLDYFTPVTEGREPATLVMSGKMSYHANVAAVTAFAEHVMPRVQRRRPEARLLLVGKDPTPDVRKLAERPGIAVTGTVDDLRPYLYRATLAVAPIQYGVGIQNKVLEAMACATPVVATSQAIGALGTTTGHDIAVADGPDEMADAVLNLLDRPDDRKRMGLAGRRYVEQHHDWRSVAVRLADIYREAAA